MRSLPCVAVVLAACGVDNRPKTIEYVTMAVLQPSCGAAECHSTFSGQDTDIFDTVKGARATLIDNNLISFDSTQYDPANPLNASLMIWITQTDPFALGIGRMPYDAPLPQEDVSLLEQFIAAKAPGAQCDPDANLGYACDNFLLTRCEDWNFGPAVVSCTGPNNNGCSLGKCECASGYGECDKQVTDGCETKLDTDGNCGGCGVSCMTATSGKTCQAMSAGSVLFACQCPVGKGDCPTSGIGCMTDLTVDGNCGACGMMCSAGTTCKQTPGMAAGVFSCQ